MLLPILLPVTALQNMIADVRARSRRRATDTQAELDALRAQLHLSVSLHSQMLLLLVAKGVCTQEEVAPLRSAFDTLLETTEDKEFDWAGLDPTGPK